MSKPSVFSALSAVAFSLLFLPSLSASERRLIETRQQEELAAALHAVKSAEATFGAKDARLADALMQLGELHRQQGRPQPAEAAFVRAKDIRLAVFGPGSLEAADAVSDVGNLYLELRRFSEAEPFLKQALTWLQIVHDEPDHPDRAGPG